jgi:hypothetical protein
LTLFPNGWTMTTYDLHSDNSQGYKFVSKEGHDLEVLRYPSGELSVQISYYSEGEGNSLSVRISKEQAHQLFNLLRRKVVSNAKPVNRGISRENKSRLKRIT